MVEDIRFPMNFPKVSRTKRVKRTARQNEEEQKQPFKKYLNQKEDQQQDGEEGKNPDKKKIKSGPTHTDQENSAAPDADQSNRPETDSPGKRIDVHA